VTCGRSDRTSCGGRMTAHRSHNRSVMSVGVPARPPKATTAPAKALLQGHNCRNFTCTAKVICIISVNKVL
jgi:hypothetical protein